MNAHKSPPFNSTFSKSWRSTIAQSASDTLPWSYNNERIRLPVRHFSSRAARPFLRLLCQPHPPVVALVSAAASLGSNAGNNPLSCNSSWLFLPSSIHRNPSSGLPDALATSSRRATVHALNCGTCGKAGTYAAQVCQCLGRGGLPSALRRRTRPRGGPLRSSSLAWAQLPAPPGSYVLPCPRCRTMRWGPARRPALRCPSLGLAMSADPR